MNLLADVINYVIMLNRFCACLNLCTMLPISHITFMYDIFPVSVSLCLFFRSLRADFGRAPLVGGILRSVCFPSKGGGL